MLPFGLGQLDIVFPGEAVAWTVAILVTWVHDTPLRPGRRVVGAEARSGPGGVFPVAYRQ